MRDEQRKGVQREGKWRLDVILTYLTSKKSSIIIFFNFQKIRYYNFF